MLVLFQGTGKFSCSFCGVLSRELDALVAGANGKICASCAASCLQAMEPKPQASSEIPDDEPPPTTDTSLLNRVLTAQSTVEANRELVEELVHELRNRKVSWAKIGESLGISRQAAWEKYS